MFVLLLLSPPQPPPTTTTIIKCGLLKGLPIPYYKCIPQSILENTNHKLTMTGP
jgi:hypothetical protein